MNPKISVVMPVFDGEMYLRQAIESILGQTFGNFEFIIINDGSTDSTEEIIRSFDDPRIVYIDNKKNLGLSKSFNIGIKKARGEYIARMDADDISLPDRFEKQINFLEDNPDIGIVGSWIRNIDEKGRFGKVFTRPVTHKELKWQALFSIPLVHPTVMARAKILKENSFDESLHNSEDYELWSRLMFEKGVKFANLPEPLLQYRVYESSFTQKLVSEKRLASAQNTIRNIRRYTPVSDREVGIIIKSRQGRKLTLSERYKLFSMYKRAAKEFEKRENFRPNLSRYFLSLIRESFASNFS